MRANVPQSAGSQKGPSGARVHVCHVVGREWEACRFPGHDATGDLADLCEAMLLQKADGKRRAVPARAEGIIIKSVPEWLVDLFARYGYAVVFFGVFLENTGLPVPGETVLLAGAALAQFGRLSIVWVIATAVAGATFGDNLGFFIGRHGGRALAERYGSNIGLTGRRLTQFDRYFARHGAKTVFIARFITGLRVFGAVLAGGSGLPWSRFLFYNATGAIVWSTVVAMAGYLMAYSWDTLERWIGRAGLVALVLFGLLVTIGAVRARRREP